MSNKIEQRTYLVAELRATKDGDKRTVGGYAAVFEKLSENLGYFRAVYEKIARGAFARSIKGADIRAFWNHNVDFILGRSTNSTLQLREDDHGLNFDLNLPDTSMGRDVFTSIERGDVNAMSFGFRVVSDRVERPQKDEDPIIRTLLDVDLIEVSPVVFPAYPQTEVSARNLDEWAKVKVDQWVEDDRRSKSPSTKELSRKLNVYERDALIQQKRLR